MYTKTKMVYLAGKVAGPKWEIPKYLEDGLATFVASDGNKHSEHLWGGGAYDLSMYGGAELQALALNDIERCDMLIAYVENSSAYGTIAEIAWASAHNRPAYLLAKGDPLMHDAYWFVSNFPGVIGMWVTDAVEAACVVDNLLKIESPIEKLFYETAMLIDPFLATCLSAQKPVKTPDFTYRVDFMLAYKEVNVAIELDGHNYHKTTDQRTHDARKDRFMQSKGLSVIRFTGSELTKNPHACVREVSQIIDRYRPNPTEDRRFDFGPEIDWENFGEMEPA